MQDILPEELPRLSCFLPAATVNAPGDMAPNGQSLDSPHHSFPGTIVYFIPLCCKEMLSQNVVRTYRNDMDSTNGYMKKLRFFWLPMKKDFPTVYYYQCSTLRKGLLKSASNYHQLPEE